MSEAPKTPANAETLPPPGAGLSEDNSSENSCIFIEAKGPNSSYIQYSIIFSLGLNGDKSSNPMDLTAI